VDGLALSWRIAIEHSTTHTYAHEVSASYNEARVIPLTLPRQICLDARVEIHPAARAYRYWDYWGSVVTAFDIHTPHTELTVVGTSVVETSPPPAAAPVASWAEVASPAAVDEHAELLAPTEYAPLGAGALDELDQLIDDLRGLPGPDAAARQATEWVRSRLRYQTGATDVHTSALEALQQGQGVCQDFAHVTLSLLRSLGIPARYASGYLHPSPDASVGEAVFGQSHAWVEWWCGDWKAWDPTHGVAIGERHVLVARGRDYADVPPLKGIYHGAPAVAHHVEVELTRLG
jgi:transglutaminase-like putative cysteine protease